MFNNKTELTRKLSRTAMAFGVGGALMLGAGAAMAGNSDTSKMESGEFSKWAEEQMNTLDREWTEFQHDAEEAGKDASEEAKENWNELVADVKEEREEAAEALREMKEGAKENWEDLSEATREAIDEFAESIKEAKKEMSGKS